MDSKPNAINFIIHIISILSNERNSHSSHVDYGVQHMNKHNNDLIKQILMVLSVHSCIATLHYYNICSAAT